MVSYDLFGFIRKISLRHLEYQRMKSMSRELRIPLADPKQNDKIEAFEYKGFKITNFEMESSALAGLSRLMGHKAMTVCMVIANRLIKEANTGYKNTIDTLIKTVLDRI